MRALINKRDNSVSFLEVPGSVLPRYDNNPTVYLVDADASCLDEIDPQFHTVLFYNTETNEIYRDPNIFLLNTPYGKAFIKEELKRIALLPVEARTEELLEVVRQARGVLPSEEVDRVLADDVLSDSEISDILSYLNDDA